MQYFNSIPKYSAGLKEDKFELFLTFIYYDYSMTTQVNRTKQRMCTHVPMRTQ